MQIYPRISKEQPIYDLTLIVDITRSMNAEDYRLNGQPVSRLEYVKHCLRELLISLPCQSKLGLGVFTERRAAILFTPIEVCSGFPEINASIASLDWRMAWAADSRIAHGLFNTLQEMTDKNSGLIFLTDGQEAPPINPRYGPDFSSLKRQTSGFIVGVGGLQPVTIPKFNTLGQRIGVYGPDDVPQRTSFGESDLNPEKIDGYDARNAPFGRAAPVGEEHLSALREDYLKQLATESGLGYSRLTNAGDLARAIGASKPARTTKQFEDIRKYYAACIIVLLLAQLI